MATISGSNRGRAGNATPAALRSEVTAVSGGKVQMAPNRMVDFTVPAVDDDTPGQQQHRRNAGHGWSWPMFSSKPGRT
jgi:hypothetical protein